MTASVLCAHCQRPVRGGSTAGRCAGVPCPWAGRGDASCEMSPDGMTLTVRVASPRGALTTRIERLPDHPWTPADVDRAVEMCRERLENAGAEPGQSSTTRRLRLPGRRHLVVHLMSGPPTWRLPKASLKDHALMVGWLRRAVAVWVSSQDPA